INPMTTHVAALWNPDAIKKSALQATEDAAERLGITVASHEARNIGDLESVFSSLSKGTSNGMVVFSDGLLGLSNVRSVRDQGFLFFEALDELVASVRDRVLVAGRDCGECQVLQYRHCLSPWFVEIGLYSGSRTSTWRDFHWYSATRNALRPWSAQVQQDVKIPGSRRGGFLVGRAGGFHRQGWSNP